MAKNKQSEKNLFCLFFSLIALPVFSQWTKAINDSLSSAPKTGDRVIVYHHLASKLKNAGSTKEKKEISIFLAEYAMRCHLFKEAGEHYMDAFSASYSNAEKDAKKHLIKALKAFIMAGDIEAGYATYGKILSIKDETTSTYNAEAELYVQYLNLAESLSDSKVDVASIIKNLQIYAKDAKFKKFRSSILLTLWFISNDKNAEKSLLKEYPNSMEAMLVNGQATIFPTTFWYLIPSLYLSGTNDIVLSDDNSIPKAYQIGFFKQKEYATRQEEKLKQQGFIVEIKEEKREKNSIYYAVFVLEKENGLTGLKLKDAGFESFPIFE